MKKKSWVVSLLILLSLIFNTKLFSKDNYDLVKRNGYFSLYNFNFGAKSAGLANSYVAIADDLTAVYSNPAGLTKIEGISFFLSRTKREIDYNYRKSEYNIGEFSHSMSGKEKGIDFISVALPLNIFSLDFSCALSYFRLFPYGITGNETTSIDKQQNHFSIENVFQGKKGIDVFALSISYSWDERLSLGFSILNYCGQGERNFYSYKEDELLFSTVNKEKLRGKSFVLGALFYVNNYVTLGFSYKSKLNNKLKYTYSLKESGKDILVHQDEINCSLPSILSLGFHLTPLWSIEFSYELSIVYYSDKEIYRNNFFPPFLNDRDLDINCLLHRMGIQLKLPINPNFHARVSLGYAIEDNIFLFNNSIEIDYRKLKIKRKTFGIGMTILGDFNIDLAFIDSKGSRKEELLNYNLLENRINNYSVVLSFGYSFSKPYDLDF